MSTKNLTTIMCVICTVLWIATGIQRISIGNMAEGIGSLVLAAVFVIVTIEVRKYYSHRR